jgi:3-deoxy-D-manno-octulosonate 8-phosphate phosphatase (KDO 8-P phosphatase)
MNYKNRLHDIRLFAFDYDGVFSSGTILLMPDGSQVRTASTRDGFAVQWAAKQGVDIALVTGGKEPAVGQRLSGLGVKHIHLGAHDKLAVVTQLAKNLDVPFSAIAYMGDDLNDFPVMKAVGLAACPQDAVPEIRAVADYVSPFAGGAGCVRDLLEQHMKLRGIWDQSGVHHW